MNDDHAPAPEEMPAAPAEDAAEDLLELVLAAHDARVAANPPPRIDGVVVGRVLSIGPEGEVRVGFPGAPNLPGLPARAMAALGAGDVGREVALLFEGGDPGKPVVMGLMHTPGAPPARAAVEVRPEPAVEADGERLVFEAGREIVLRCGDASITLTRAGKVLIRGAYVLSRSSGVHRIQGGSVQIN